MESLIEKNFDKMDFDNFELELPPRMRIHLVFHIFQPTKNRETKEDINATEEEYEGEKMLDQRVRNGIPEYLIQWKGYTLDDNSWETTKNLNCPCECNTVIETTMNEQRLDLGYSLKTTLHPANRWKLKAVFF